MSNGICPHCRREGGEVGEACPQKVCQEAGYYLIPIEQYKHARELARKKGKPIDSMVGRMVDNYLLIGKLGEGGMGSVYLALQRPLDRKVALKVISGMELTKAAVARFEREARSIALLEHPNIVKLYDYGIGKVKGDREELKVPFMALEYVKHGIILFKALKRMREANQGTVPRDVLLHIFTQILNALGEAHTQGLIHRDMKPSNILITKVRGNPYLVKLLDFGLAKAVSDITGFEGEITHTGQLLGTPMYMAPEQVMRARGRKDLTIDHRVDLYAVAVMLYEIFTGRHPFEGDSALEILLNKIEPDPDPLTLPEAKALPQPIRVFLAKGMAVDPQERFQDADEMLTALRNALAGRYVAIKGLPPGQESSSRDVLPTPSTPSADYAEELPTMVMDDPSEASELPKRGLSTRHLVYGGILVVLILLGLFAFSNLSGPSLESSSIQMAKEVPTHVELSIPQVNIRVEEVGALSGPRRNPDSLRVRSESQRKARKKGRPMKKKRIKFKVPLI